jgi:hypothetical protein
MLKIPKTIKLLGSRLAIFLVIIISILYSHQALVVYLFGNDVESFSDWALQDIVNSVLEIPYHKKNFVIDRPDYIKTLSSDEWMKVQCKPMNHDKSEIVVGARNYEHISMEEKWHLNCIAPFAVKKISNKDVNGELCSNIFNCQVLSLAVNDYVFQHPEILWSIVKIAERPCDYIKTFDEKLKDSNPTPQERYSMDSAKSARRDLCGKKPFFMSSRKFVLITVQDIENKQIMDIIVRRQDVD